MNTCALVHSWQLDDRCLRIGLHTATGLFEISVPVSAEVREALEHVHPATPACPGVTEGMVKTLRRVANQLDGAISRLVVRPGPEPAFWLRVGDGDRWTELDLDVITAAAVLASGTVPVELTCLPSVDWDGALKRITEGGQR